MANIQILYDDVSKNTSSISASSTSGTLIALNMLNEYKGQVHRSSSTSVTYTLIWNSPVKISCIALPATNLTTTSTIKVTNYSSSTGGSPITNTGFKLAAPGLNLSNNTWSTARDVNSFFYGGAAKTFVIFAPVTIQRCVIELVDTSNPAGYIDCARVVCGEYWQPTYNVQKGINLSVEDTSDINRADSGDVMTDIGVLYDQINFDFSILPESDRTTLVKLMRRVGNNKNIFISVLPEDVSNTAEQDFMIYGKKTGSSVSYEVYGFYNSSMQISSW